MQQVLALPFSRNVFWRWIEFYLPLPLILALILYGLAGAPAPAQHLRQVLDIVVALLFLNHLHIFFTFAFVLHVPEFKAMIRRDRRRRLLHFISLPVLLLTGTALLTATKYSAFAFTFSPLVIALITGALLVYAQNHLLSQSKGILLSLRERQHGGSRSCRRMRAAYEFTIMTYLAWFFLYILTVGGIVLPPLMQSLQTILQAAFSLGSVLTVLAVARDATASQREKIFSLRVLLLPLVPFMPIALLALGVIHGTEYLCVLRKVRHNSRMNPRQQTWLMRSILLMILAALPLYVCRVQTGLAPLLWQDLLAYPLWAKLLGAASVGLSFMHYYLDRQIFLMRRPEVRELVAPLLADRL